MEFYSVSDKKYNNPIFIISNELEQKMDYLFDLLEKETSLVIDSYSRNVLYPVHVKVLFSEICKNKNYKGGDCIPFKEFLVRVIEENEAIILLGD